MAISIDVATLNQIGEAFAQLANLVRQLIAAKAADAATIAAITQQFEAEVAKVADLSATNEAANSTFSVLLQQVNALKDEAIMAVGEAPAPEPLPTPEEPVV